MSEEPAATIDCVASQFHFEDTLAFVAEEAEAILREVPAEAGVLALFGVDDEAQPYLTRAADLRRRARRLLSPPEQADGLLTKRLNLRERVARIEYTVTGSEFASGLVLYHAAVALFGYAEARRRLKLHTPYCLRFTAENAFPRLYVTNRLSRRGLPETFGPFASRAAAERVCDAVLDLFKLRRCFEDLTPSPEHPGCVYQEMKKCLAPCNQAVTPEARATYAAEAEAVVGFLRSRGESLLSEIAARRERASAEMDFEAAAALHVQHQKTKAAAIADPLVGALPTLRAVIVQAAAHQQIASETGAAPSPDEAAIFLMSAGCLSGPERLSTLGVRAVKEQTSVGSSLFAQPLMLQAVPLGEDGAQPTDTAMNPEARAAKVLERLEVPHSGRAAAPVDLALLSDHLALLRRWYYRPERQRAGEIFFANGDGSWPVRRILRGAARMALGDPAPMAETDREAAKVLNAAAKTKVLHAGRPDVERTVPVAERQREAESPADAPDTARAFTSRRKQRT